MAIPFKIILHHKMSDGSYTNTIDSEKFVNDERQLYHLSDIIFTGITENRKLELEFICDDMDARLYMDGLDTIPAQSLEIEGDGPAYLKPTNNRITLYTPKENNNPNSQEYYPFIPGYYRIKVLAFGKVYYSWLKVEPKQITEDQWVAMRDEVEDTLNGLAQDLILKNSSIGLDLSVTIPVHILRKLYIVKNDFQKWIIALRNISANPRIRVGKQYCLVPHGKAARMDSVTIRYRARHPESRDMVYSPSHVRNYNLLENQWVKKISKFLIREMNDLYKYLKAHKDKVKDEMKRTRRYHRGPEEENIQLRLKRKVLGELEEYERFVSRVRSECLFLLQAEWMVEVEEKTPMSVPHAMLMDERYKRFYSLYRSLKTEKFSVSFDSNYDFYWKRTDLLYEIWGFLQIVNALQHPTVGFEVVGGWIYSNEFDSRSIQVPFLEPGTVIELKKEDVKLRVVYDETVPYNANRTTLYNPIYAVEKHTRPDVRLDFYHSEEYLGSIIMDFKYRPLHFVWDQYKVYSSKKTDAMQQLISYRNFHSSWSFRNLPIGLRSQFRPIYEVWAVYPKHEGNSDMESPMRDFKIRLMELTPLEEREELFSGLNDAISKVLSTIQNQN
ncbi:DUF2357 domain-containing protein [Peribacillus muralis]|uniref:DUF2357 domain-containing protein n=1 Tax=Peribacillus muralis TaxID=264697 RepID=UPI003D053FFA